VQESHASTDRNQVRCDVERVCDDEQSEQDRDKYLDVRPNRTTINSPRPLRSPAPCGHRSLEHRHQRDVKSATTTSKTRIWRLSGRTSRCPTVIIRGAGYQSGAARGGTAQPNSLSRDFLRLFAATFAPAITLWLETVAHSQRSRLVTAGVSSFTMMSSQLIHTYKETSMSLEGEYERVRRSGARSSGTVRAHRGAEGNTLRDTGLPIVIVTTRGNKMARSERRR